MTSDPVQTLLRRAGWHLARRVPMAGDASSKSFERLHHPDGITTAILMRSDSPDMLCIFSAVTEIMQSRGLSVPEILAENPDAGVMLLEDLGDAKVTRILERHPEHEAQIYAAAADALTALHPGPMPPLRRYDTPLMIEQADFAYDWYAPNGDGAVFSDTLRQMLEAHVPPVFVVMLRDYHADNLIWLPARDGIRRVGILDYQDALLAHPAYDLVSLLQDARRDVSPEVETAIKERAIARFGQEPKSFDAAYAALGVQRAVRILGMFARLCLHLGKPQYLAMMPRVWAYLQRNLAHPALVPMRPAFQALLPEPTPHFIETLRSQCGTIPTP